MSWLRRAREEAEAEAEAEGERQGERNGLVGAAKRSLQSNNFCGKVRSVQISSV